MKKLAIFVEGQTELLFVQRLLVEIAGRHALRVQTASLTGKRGIRQVKMLDTSADTESEAKYHVLIFNCSCDEQVKSDVLERRESLSKSGFERVIGIRDLFPRPRTERDRIERYGVPTSGIPTTIICAVMELEAWFLAEDSHLTRLDPRLTLDLVRAALGFCPRGDDVELRANPAKDLANAYALAGQAYTKSRESVNRTIDVLDYGQMYLSLGSRVPSLGRFLDQLGLFFV